MEKFDELDLPQGLQHTLTHMEFNTPTPIQAQAIPPALEGRDILGSAQTGTGKTGAFGIPLVTRLLTNPRGSALVLTPTRELAVQVLDQLKNLLGKRSPIKTALLIGGESMPKQIQALRNRPRVLVGTPGRINDHLERGSLMLHDTSFLVLDETDRMLDMGFTIQIEQILKFMPKQRQTLLFSATLPNNIVSISKKYLTNPVRVSVDAQSSVVEKIKQEVIHVTDADKYDALLKELDNRTGSIIVFIKTKHGADKMATRLSKLKYSVDAIHGDLRQNKRDRVLAAFRDSKFRILIATDVAARGLDIPHIEHVINYDLPQAPEDYVHRIGRTARAGAEGNALCLITPKDRIKWRAIERLLDPDAKQSDDDAPQRDYKKKSSNGRGRSGGGGRGAPRGGDRNRSGGGKSGQGKRGDSKRSDGESRGGEKRGDKPNRSKSRRPDGEKRSEGGNRSDSKRGDGQKRGGEKRGDKPSYSKSRKPDGAKRSEGGKRPEGGGGKKDGASKGGNKRFGSGGSSKNTGRPTGRSGGGRSGGGGNKPSPR